MAGKQARILTDKLYLAALQNLGRRRQAARDTVLFLLSIRAGLRACEIANLQWRMVLTADRQMGPCLNVEDRIAKMKGGRRIPMHPELRQALLVLAKESGTLNGPIIASRRGGSMNANSVVNWFAELYRTINAEGCSSHSGRRTFITKAARNAHKAGASLRDVQLLAGHRSIEITQRYIEGDTEAQRRLVQQL